MKTIPTLETQKHSMNSYHHHKIDMLKILHSRDLRLLNTIIHHQ